MAYVTVAATPKTDDRASKIGKLFLDDSLVLDSAHFAKSMPFVALSDRLAAMGAAVALLQLLALYLFHEA